MKKNQKGFLMTDAALGIAIFLIFSVLNITILLNIYNVKKSEHRLAMATNYAVEILENSKLLNYYDLKLENGTYTGKKILGIRLEEDYNATFTVEEAYKNYENTGEVELYKILKINIQYNDGDLLKNIEIKTLKLNK